MEGPGKPESIRPSFLPSFLILIHPSILPHIYGKEVEITRNKIKKLTNFYIQLSLLYLQLGMALCDL